MLIRAATTADLPAIRDVLVTSWHATYDAIYGRERVNSITADWHSLIALGRLVDFGPASLMVTQLNNLIVATATATMISDTDAKLDRLYVTPSAQGRGIGANLMLATLARLPEASTVRLEVEPANTAAVAFYVRYGFARIGEVRDCGRVGSAIRADVYARSLPI